MSTLQPRKRRSLSRNCPRVGFNVSGTFRNRGQFWRSSRPLIRSGGKSGDFLAHTHLFFKVHRQEVARPEHQPRRCLGTRERHGRALVADFGVRKRLAGFGVPDAQHRPRRSRSPAFVGDALRHEMIWSIAERTGVSESARLPFPKAKESSLFENPSNRFGRPGPPAYSRAIWLNFSRSLLSGMENKARKIHFKAVSFRFQLRGIAPEGWPVGCPDLIGGERLLLEDELTRLAEACLRHPLSLRVAASFLTTHKGQSVARYVERIEEARTRLRLEGQPDHNVMAGSRTERQAIGG